jgi:short-subunit dehydrogenase
MRPLSLVTGGSSGIGLAVSRRLAARGYDLAWVGLERSELEAAQTQVGFDCSDVTIETLALDLSQADAADRVFAWANGLKPGGVDLLINNAGLGVYGDSADLPLEAEQTMIGVNISALHSLTRVFLEAMQAKGAGTIVNVASNSAFVPTPRLAVYASTKAFVHHYSSALQQELQASRSPVRIMTVCPSAVSDTPFKQRASMDRVRTFSSFTATTADEVADDIIKGLDRGARRVVTGAAMRRAMVLMKLAPAPLLKWLTRRETREN